MGMTPRQEFKVAFLTRCAAAGLTPDQVADAAEEMADTLSKTAFVGEAARAAGGLFNAGSKALGVGVGWGLPIAIMAPLAAGYGAGHLAGRLRSTADDADPEEVKRQELIDEYRRQTALARRHREARLAAASLARPAGRPVL